MKRSARSGLVLAALLVVLMGILFHTAFQRDYVVFANDAPLGRLKTQEGKGLSNFLGVWLDQNWLGEAVPTALPDFSNALYLLAGPVGFAKTYAPLSLVFLGLCAWLFFRRLGFHPVVCVLGGLAASLNTNVFSNACWGLPSRALTLGGAFLALAALQSATGRISLPQAAVAGFALGFGIMEGFDIGAIFSLYVAAFALFQALCREGAWPQKTRRGLGTIALMAVCAALISAQALFTLVGTQVKGVAGLTADAAGQQRNWNWATQWSLPKIETLRVVIPGLFGYRLDTAKGGNYWGAVGQNPNWQQDHAGFARHSGSGEYAGILVALLALWALAQSMRGQQSPFNPAERRRVWFWSGMALISLLLAFGRHAPFYQWIYPLPFFSTFRSPIKLMHPFHLCLLVLFGYGLHDLIRRYVEAPGPRLQSLEAQLKSWWRSLAGFERRWTYGCLAATAVSLLGWLVYASARNEMIQYLQTQAFDAAQAAAIHTFSSLEVGWSVVMLILSVGVVAGLLSRIFAGERKRWAFLLLGLVLLFDLVRASVPWIHFYNYKEKYASNPILDILRDQPYLKRVVLWPYQMNEPMTLLQNLYSLEWLQQQFQYYLIQSLDIIQESREAVINAAYREAFSKTNVQAQLRLWQLTNTRLLLGLGNGFAEVLNQQLDPQLKRFRLHTAFDIGPKGTNATRFEDLTATLNTNGQVGLIEFTGALPRARLYAQWQTSTNEAWVLQQLTAPAFDPQQTVLVSQALPKPGGTPATNANPGTVDYSSYSPKRIRLLAKAEAPSVLLLNDKYDPDWKVTVDGKSAPLLRCNYIMRGVYLELGPHTVEFRYQPSITALYISLASWLAGLTLLGYLGVERKNQLSPVAA